MCDQHILQILRNLNMWLMNCDLWKRTAHNEKNVNIQMHFTTYKWSHNYAMFVMMKNKQKLFFWLLQNYNPCSKKYKMLNLSFKTFFIHILAKQKRQSNVRQRRRHTGVSSLTVN